ncbi:hypothetical protein ILT44_27405 [Microvirga sp. BT689]|uniref:hypothetical protein n=1 Tax=Microvirga arvi TaxID=2778731 RepID=UPI00194FB573|nr:hypothetical protein [Microvirga arvi]MBM6583934.1 hypothetical protein [Microvirga arvi]
MILVAGLLSTVPVVAQEAPALWRDPEAGCIYFKLGNTLSLRHQRDGWPDCPDAQRAVASSGSPAPQAEPVTRDDVRDVTRAIEGLSRRLDDIRREYERRGRY